MKNRLLFKTVSLLIVLALLMAGLSMIQDVVKDRIRNRDYAVQSVVSSLAGSQRINVPLESEKNVVEGPGLSWP